MPQRKGFYMATPTQIRKERKEALKAVNLRLSNLNTTLEQARRLTSRILKVKKRFPDAQDASNISAFLTKMDSEMNQVVSALSNFTSKVSVF